jgi:hypothetical protein
MLHPLRHRERHVLSHLQQSKGGCVH